MGNPLAVNYYRESLVKYTQLVASILSDLRVNVEGNVVRIPIQYMGGKRNQNKTTDVVSTGLSSTLKITGFQVVAEAVLNRNITKVVGEEITHPPLPVVLEFQFRMRFKKFNDMAQALETLVFQTYPHLTLKTSTLGTEEVLVLSPTGQDWDNDWEGSGEEPSYYDATFGFELHGGHFHGPNLLEQEPQTHGIIKEVDVFFSTSSRTLAEDETFAWLNVYGSEYDAATRFDADKPLQTEPVSQGAWLYTPEAEPEVDLIGSGVWIRGDFA